MTVPVRVELPDQPGWSGVSVGDVHVLVRAGSAVVERIRHAGEEGGLDDVLDALTKEGLRATPDFVAVHAGDPVRVVARGRAYAVASGPQGTAEIRAAARGPWADEDAGPGTTSVSLHTGEEPAAPQPPPDPPVAAVAQAAPQATTPPPPDNADASGGKGAAGWRAPQLFARPKDSASLDPASPQPARATSAVEAQGEVEELPSYDHLFGATQNDRPSYLEPHDTQNVEEPIGHAPIESAGGFSPSDPPVRSQHTLAPPQHTVQPAPPGPAPTPSQRPAEAPSGPVAPRPGGLIESVPWRTRGSAPAPSPPAAAQPVPAAQPAPAPQPSAPAPPAPAVPAAQPGRPGAAHAPSPAPAAGAGGSAPAVPADDAEATVDRRALLGGPGVVESGPPVLAVLCPAGHASPPHSGTCRLCGREIPPQQPFSTPRPPLGVLHLASGDLVRLDRGVLLGRSPKVNADLPAAERPHLVRVPSPENDISRNHVEIVLEDWHVLIRDLGSTNGTTVTLPGQPAVRLRPNDQQVLEPGTVITLADEVSLTYEVGA